MSDYSGPDRRHERADGRAGRRREDLYCPEHHMRVELANERHTAAEKRDAAICSKVTAAEDKISKRVDHLEGALDKMREIIVGKWVFWVMVGVLFSSIATVGLQQNWAFKEILENQREFARELGTVSDQGKANANQIQTLGATLEVLSRRQDVLRDQNMQLLNRLGETR